MGRLIACKQLQSRHSSTLAQLAEASALGSAARVIFKGPFACSDCSMALPRALGATLLPRCAGLLQQSVGASASPLSPLASVGLCRFAADAAEAGDETIEVEVHSSSSDSRASH